MILIRTPPPPAHKKKKKKVRKPKPLNPKRIGTFLGLLWPRKSLAFLRCLIRLWRLGNFNPRDPLKGVGGPLGGSGLGFKGLGLNTRNKDPIKGLLQEVESPTPLKGPYDSRLELSLDPLFGALAFPKDSGNIGT